MAYTSARNRAVHSPPAPAGSVKFSSSSVPKSRQAVKPSPVRSSKRVSGSGNKPVRNIQKRPVSSSESTRRPVAKSRADAMKELEDRLDSFQPKEKAFSEPQTKHKEKSATTKPVSDSPMEFASAEFQAESQPSKSENSDFDPAIPQATPVTGHFNIVCLTAMGYNRLIDILLREANYYDKLGGIGKDAVQVMENMVYTFSKSSSRFTALDGSKEVLLTVMDEDFTNILGILLKAAYLGKEDPATDYSQSLPYAGT